MIYWSISFFTVGPWHETSYSDIRSRDFQTLLRRFWFVYRFFGTEKEMITLSYWSKNGNENEVLNHWYGYVKGGILEFPQCKFQLGRYI